MKTIKLYCVIEGGLLRDVYGDAMPEGYKLEITRFDLDNDEEDDDTDAEAAAREAAQAFYF